MVETKKRAKKSKKIIKLQEELEAEQQKSRDYLNQLKYLQADFENYKKRIEKDSLDVSQRANERLVINLLNVMDDLERTIETIRTTDNVKSLSEGIEMTLKNLRTMLEREGLARIESAGNPFNPNIHEVLIQVPTDEYEEGIVIEEARKGFKFKGKVIRPSVVMIASKPNEGVDK
jgi:molecular chaperone GrpE